MKKEEENKIQEEIEEILSFNFGCDCSTCPYNCEPED